jgi:hypothetical protein
VPNSAGRPLAIATGIATALSRNIAITKTIRPFFRARPWRRAGAGSYYGRARHARATR